MECKNQGITSNVITYEGYMLTYMECTVMKQSMLGNFTNCVNPNMSIKCWLKCTLTYMSFKKWLKSTLTSYLKC